MYVSGITISNAAPAVKDTPLTVSVAFLKSKDAYVTSDYWRIVVHFDYAIYEDTIATLHSDVLQMKKITQRPAYEDTMAILRKDATDEEEITR
jgi:predicted component of type VI protein secretion system